MEKMINNIELLGVTSGVVSLASASEALTAVGAIASALCAIIALCRILVKAVIRINKAIKEKNAAGILPALEEAQKEINEVREEIENDRKKNA